MAEYRVGTVDLVNGSPEVAGAGTYWASTIPPVQAGQMIILGGVPYFIATVTDDTHLQISAPYGGASATGAAYTIVRDYTPALGLPLPQPTTIHLAALLQRGLGILDASGRAAVQVWEVSGVWQKPTGITTVEVFAIGAGGGGGSGRVGSRNITGGGGGGAGGVVRHRYRAADLPASVNVDVPAGGAGGGAVSMDNTDGQKGGDGGDASFGGLVATGGRGGEGGVGPVQTGVATSSAAVGSVTASRMGVWLVGWRSTGNGWSSIGTITLGEDVEEGAYILVCTASATNGGTFSVTTPSGEVLADLTVGVAYVSTHISMTLPDGTTDYVVGDVITMDVSGVHVSEGSGAVRVVTIGAAAEVGDYTLTCTATSPNAGTFTVVSPSGGSLADLTVGVAYVSTHINLTIADGATDWALGDTVVVGIVKTDAAGTGDIGSATLGASVEVGDYTLTCTATSPNAGTFTVVSPSGDTLADLTVGVAYVSTHISLTIADGATDWGLRDQVVISVGVSMVVGAGGGGGNIGNIATYIGGAGGPATPVCGVGISAIGRCCGGGGGGGGGVADDLSPSPGGGGGVGFGGVASNYGAAGEDGQAGDGNGADMGTGGGGGGAGVAANGGNGGAGGGYGAGGGGGGAATNGCSSGAGGDGAPGVVIVTMW